MYSGHYILDAQSLRSNSLSVTERRSRLYTNYMAASDSTPRPTSFEKFVSAVTRVPKSEVDIEQAERNAEPRMKPGRKAKPKPAA